MHVGYDLEARPRRGDRILQRLFHLGVQRRRRVAAPIRGAVGNLPVVGDVADRDLRITQDLDQLLADFFLRMPGEDPAVHVGGRALRQRVIGVTPLEPCGDTGRVQNARDGRDLHEPLEGLAVGRVRENAPVVRGFLAGRLCGHALEIAARDVVELEREAELLESQEPRGELVDRVVGSRLRAVAAPVGDGQLVVAVHLLGGAQLEYLGHAVLGSDRVSVVVQHELGIDELPVIPDEPVDAVAAAALLVRRERKNDVATRAKTLVLHPQQRRRHDGIAILHILRAAAVEVAVLLDELEGIGAPVLAPRLDHVEVADEQHRPVLGCATEPHHQVLLALVETEHRDVGGGEARVPEALRRRFGGGGDVADGVGGVDFDQLLQDLVSERVGRLVGFRGGGCGGPRRRRRQSRDQERRERCAPRGAHGPRPPRGLAAGSCSGSSTSKRNVPGWIAGRGWGCSGLAGGGGPKSAVTR